jgi:hypothetical protein
MKIYNTNTAETIVKDFLNAWREELKSSNKLFTNITQARISPNPRRGLGSYLSLRSEQCCFNCDISFEDGNYSVDFVCVSLTVDTWFLYPDNPKKKSSIEIQIPLSKIQEQPEKLRKVFCEWIKTELLISDEFKTRLEEI